MSSVSRLRETGPLRKLRREINELRDQVKSLRIRPGAGYFIRPSTTGQVLEIRPGKGTQGEDATADLQYCCVQIMCKHHYICQKVRPDTTASAPDGLLPYGDAFYVHRPQALWNTYSDSRYTNAEIEITEEPTADNFRTVRYTIASGLGAGDYDIQEAIWPLVSGVDETQFDVGGTRILCAKNVEGLPTSVPTEFQYDGTILGMLPDSNACEWTDLNIAGSAWLPGYLKVFEACEAGEYARYVLATNQVGGTS